MLWTLTPTAFCIPYGVANSAYKRPVSAFPVVSVGSTRVCVMKELQGGKDLMLGLGTPGSSCMPGRLVSHVLSKDKDLRCSFGPRQMDPFLAYQALH